MGSINHLECSACGAIREPCLGIGMAFPSVYRETIDEIRQGKHGEEWHSIVESGEHIAVDAEDKLFVCGSCGAWEVAPDLSLYEPKDVAKLLAEQFGDKTVAEWGETPYVTSWDLEKNYRLLRHREHLCPDCGGDMRSFDDFEGAPNVKCPECGDEMAPGPGLVLWD